MAYATRNKLIKPVRWSVSEDMDNVREAGNAILGRIREAQRDMSKAIDEREGKEQEGSSSA